MARDLREDAARSVVQEAQQQAAEAGPTLAEMVGRLRGEAAIMNRTNEARAERGAAPAYTVPDVRRAEQLAAALAEIDRRLTALEGRGLDPELQRDAAKICAFLDGCTAQITVDELARWVGLPAARVIEVVGRTGLRHRWLV